MASQQSSQAHKFQKSLRRSRRQSSSDRRQQKVISLENFVITLALLVAAGSGHNERPWAEALHIRNFRVPSYVPINLASTANGELTKPLLFDCDYDYDPNEDSRLTVKWFRNKEAEPFYQWLPELHGSQHYADWILPLVNQSFVSDPMDPMKRYRSLLVKRLSMNLTGQYTCLVSSLGGQDSRTASLVIYQPPRAFTFEHRVFPALAAPVEQPPSLLASPLAPRPPPPPLPQPPPPDQLDGSGWRAAGGRPTQFKVFTQPALIVRPANNDNQASSQSANNGSLVASQRVVYTHDGRPVRKPIGRSKRQIGDWMLRQRLAGSNLGSQTGQQADSPNALQLHHLQCSASQVTPRPTLVLTVKRDTESIAQYLHESSTLSVRPYQVSWADYLQDLAKLRAKSELEGSLISKDVELAYNASSSQASVTLYDITVSATVALNVSLSPAPKAGYLHQVSSAWAQLQAAGINTVLSFRRGQRMSFECQLEITGTEFEQRRRININEDEVFQLAEMEEQRRRLKLQQDVQAYGRRGPMLGTSPGSPFNLLAPSLPPSQSSSSAEATAIRSVGLQAALVSAAILLCLLAQPSPDLDQKSKFYTRLGAG